jgi:hypothetical protein
LAGAFQAPVPDFGSSSDVPALFAGSCTGIKMTTTAVADYQGTSGPLNTSAIRVLAPVDIKGFDPASNRSAGFAVIRAHYNFVQPINVPGLTNNHVVMASITEVFPNPASGQIDLPGIGAAQMFVRSVAPQNGTLFVSGYIDWDQDLNIRISLFIA